MKKFLCVALTVLMLSALLAGCGLEVPRPEIKEGEFAFTVTYEYLGEMKTVSGVYVCEFNGTDWALDGGSHRDWKGYIRDGGEDSIVIGIAEDGGKIELSYMLYPEYFMGDPETGGKEIPAPMITVMIVDGEGMIIYNEADIIEERYGARIVSYEYAEPIENTFGGLFN